MKKKQLLLSVFYFLMAHILILHSRGMAEGPICPAFKSFMKNFSDVVHEKQVSKSIIDPLLGPNIKGRSQIDLLSSVGGKLVEILDEETGIHICEYFINNTYFLGFRLKK